MKSIYLAFGIITSSFISPIVFGNPDIGFTDSETHYNGSYLRHELYGNRIRFVIEGNIDNIRMPEGLFLIDNLRAFIRTYRPVSRGLRQEFIDMLHQSMYSRYKARTFLLAFKRLMHDYTAYRRRILAQ